MRTKIEHFSEQDRLRISLIREIINSPEKHPRHFVTTFFVTDGKAVKKDQHVISVTKYEVDEYDKEIYHYGVCTLIVKPKEYMFIFNGE